ncbi:hypothetical protein ACTMS0_20620 [Micromonospora sp. H33]|uniref:hypothetical protein n=1 Tax=Micromonospora sp. H33 TaxID=3452215 RepID=UPI003F8B2590
MTQPDDRTTPGGWTPDDGATVHLGRPHPWDDQPTGRLGPDEPTIRLGGDEPTTRLDAAGATVHLGRDQPTTRLGSDVATARVVPAPGRGPEGQPTVHLRTPEPVEERTVHLAGSAPTWEQTTASHGGVVGARTPGATPPATGGEVRFGPGVPAAPPAAPPWPSPAPPPRRRPLWRRVTSVLSTLLTVVLVAVVGWYLWQRLSPLEIAGVTVAVPEPAGDRCDVTVDVVATVTTNGRAGEIRYQWLRSGSAPGAVLTERVGRGQPTVDLTLRWTFSGVGRTAETATVNITAPSPAQARTVVTYDCRR